MTLLKIAVIPLFACALVTACASGEDSSNETVVTGAQAETAQVAEGSGETLAAVEQQGDDLGIAMLDGEVSRSGDVTQDDGDIVSVAVVVADGTLDEVSTAATSLIEADGHSQVFSVEGMGVNTYGYVPANDLKDIGLTVTDNSDGTCTVEYMVEKRGA